MTGEGERELERGCIFCYLPEPWRVIYSTENFKVQMGLGPPAEGYVLLLSNTHLSCCGSIPEDIAFEFETLVSLMQQVQTNVYGASLFFEHGRNNTAVPPGEENDLCYHAHLHMVPAKVDLSQIVENDFPTEHYESWAAVRSRYSLSGQPYILAQGDGQMVYAESPINVRKRYLRSTVSEALKRGLSADWERFPRYDQVRAGRSRLVTELKSMSGA